MAAAASEKPVTMKPLGNRALVLRSEPANKSKGGIILPDNSKERPKGGVVIAVGPGKRGPDGMYIPLPVKKDDCVMFTTYAGHDIEHDGKEYVVLSEDDILCVIN